MVFQLQQKDKSQFRYSLKSLFESLH